MKTAKEQAKDLIDSYIKSLNLPKQQGHDRLRELETKIELALTSSEDTGYEQALQTIEIKLLDGTESNVIRAKAAALARELRADIKKFETKRGI